MKLLAKKIVGAAAVLGSLGVIACTPAKWHETVKLDEQVPGRQTADTKPEDLQPKQRLYITTNDVPARTSPDQPASKTPILLARNERVEVVDPTPKGPDQTIEVRLLNNPQLASTPIFVEPRYLSQRKAEDSKEVATADRYFMIQNIATEKLRVYERCDIRENPKCVHQLVAEMEMTPGEDTPDKALRTMLGFYRITSWYKFYQDADDNFPSWFQPQYPPLPAVGADLPTWQSPLIMPKGKKAGADALRGAFGWYTAHIAPNASYQWIHGTVGWGADGDRFVKLPTHGCTRVSNPGIAFLRDFLPRGTIVLKIYAKEALHDPKLAHYQGQKTAKWNWILTKEGPQKDGPKSGRASVLKRSPKPDDILEEGTSAFAQVPTVSGGNVYKLPESSLKGILLVDEGRLVNYEHPQELKVGGFRDVVLPAIAISSDARPLNAKP